MFWKIGFFALVTWWISDSQKWGFWTVALGLGVGWLLYYLARRNGWLGLSPAPATRDVSDGMKKFIIGFATLTLVMMVGTAVIGVSNNYAFSSFLGLGFRPWLYPSGVPTDLLIWVALFAISVGVAVLTANGRWGPAGMIFGVTLVLLFIARELPRVAEFARPKSITPMAVAPIPPPTTKWEEADQATAEGRGIAPVVADTLKKAVIGDNVAMRSGSSIRETVGGFLVGLFPSIAAPTTTTTSTVVVTPPPPPPEFPDRGESHATKTAPAKAYLDPIKTDVQPSRPARYIFLEDPEVFFDDTGACVNNSAWRSMPRGKYLVVPLDETADIFFRWGPGILRGTPISKCK